MSGSLATLLSWAWEEVDGGAAGAAKDEMLGCSEGGSVLYDARWCGGDGDGGGRKVGSMGDAWYISAEAVLAVAE